MIACLRKENEAIRQIIRHRTAVGSEKGFEWLINMTIIIWTNPGGGA